ncbi:MAG: SPASM domain-containing protein [Desulfobacula sp.]|jgi:hypothetical protein|nr:SPASM domain-containing protein [Desulfobacula sp.]
MLNVPTEGIEIERLKGNVVVGCSLSRNLKHNLGNIFEKPFDEIWNGATMQRLRKQILSDEISYCRDICLLHRNEHTHIIR